ncbi:transcriptional regulator, LysR family [Pseudovibrio sp. FO-BEG1]|uniref:LysR family transcriptional regulator n=1 Tax=Pseudovibrio sp. (strain FO-BEG1) TaxID=911045 RepID=UPI000238C498|nr:LysR family transcriptional regulator [Pseudovibrio sp. FO-BEG1]AEV39582.1 transcriptional regulator, LysR family [Pseudovibrio sp. FO-BEG1]
MTNLDHLNAISTICEVGSFQLASEKLNKARSAVSYSVKQVEEFYQLQIFDRSKYRPKLTPEGKTLLVQIRRLLEQAKAFEDSVKDLKGENEPEIRLAVSSIFPVTWITDLLKSLRTKFPQTTIHLDVEVASGERVLLSEAVDMAIFAAPTRNASLDYKPITSMDVPLVISYGLLGDNAPHSLTRASLAEHPQIVVKSSDAQSPDTGLLADAPKWFVTDLQAKKDLITSGLGWGRLPRHMIAQEVTEGVLKPLPTLGEISLSICLARRGNHHLGPVASHIWNYFDGEHSFPA